MRIYRGCTNSYSREYHGGIASINRDPIRNAGATLMGGRRIRVWNDLSFIRVRSSGRATRASHDYTCAWKSATSPYMRGESLDRRWWWWCLRVSKARSRLVLTSWRGLREGGRNSDSDDEVMEPRLAEDSWRSHRRGMHGLDSIPGTSDHECTGVVLHSGRIGSIFLLRS